MHKKLKRKKYKKKPDSNFWNFEETVRVVGPFSTD